METIDKEFMRGYDSGSGSGSGYDSGSGSGNGCHKDI